MNNNELKEEDYPVSKGGIHTKYYTPLLNLFYNIYLWSRGGSGGVAGGGLRGGGWPSLWVWERGVKKINIYILNFKLYTVFYNLTNLNALKNMYPHFILYIVDLNFTLHTVPLHFTILTVYTVQCTVCVDPWKFAIIGRTFEACYECSRFLIHQGSIRNGPKRNQTKRDK